MLEAALSEWVKLNTNYQRLDLLFKKQELDKKVEWFQETITELLNKHAEAM